VARETGRRVIGIDSSPAMLEQAQASGADLDLRLGDIRDLALDEPAALIYCPFRSLFHLPTWADRRRVFWATKNEWLGLIDVAGLELEALYGDFDGTPVGDESREYVFVARKP